MLDIKKKTDMAKVQVILVAVSRITNSVSAVGAQLDKYPGKNGNEPTQANP